MKSKLFILIALVTVTNLIGQTLQEAGISETARNFIRNSGFEEQIINDERLQYCLNGIIYSDPAPTGAISITTVNQLLNNITAGTISSPKTYFVDGTFVLNATQTINIPSHVIVYVRGSIFKTGDHDIILPGATDLGPENSDEHIFLISNSRNVKLIGIDNPIIESNPEGDEYNRATGFYLQGSNNIEIRGFHIKNVWEGVNCRWEVDRALIRNNYIQNTNKRAVWLLGANECIAVHNFIDNAGWDGFDWDAFAGSRSPDNSGTLDTSASAIGAPVATPTGNLGNTGFENFVIGSGRFMGFVEEGARDTFIVNNIGFMANYLPANPIRLGFQLGWADNASSEGFMNDTGLRTEDNVFVSNVIYRPEAYNIEDRAGRVRGGGEYFAKDGTNADPNFDRKGLTYFFANEGYGTLKDGSPIGQTTNPDFFRDAIWNDNVPTNFESFDNRYADFNPQTRVQALKDKFRIGTTTTLTPEGPVPVIEDNCNQPPTGLKLLSVTANTITFSFDNEATNTRTFELRSYPPGTSDPFNVNTNSNGWAGASAGATTITMGGRTEGQAYDFSIRALCSGQTPGTSSPSEVVTLTFSQTLSTEDFKTEASNIIIYPNPTADIINIESKSDLNTLEIYDIIGKKVSSYGNKKAINISSLNPGIYFLKLSLANSQSVITKRIIKK
ncbi:T9SS type A sorting domain-containing protein [Flavivirga eckloniae]|uniref:Fibronectin type-III domain-containing protein n=1 Tax=Flavivirga eckloniae TaxID=1803846 RepID=A0A2K9PRH4_9FLAO|nr:T9SS type A sorting domain-containing protein [Flavivirga eckloniae]AUP79664.1 hypothetical protein C1H87_13480 [Flavivirga eckloniae]